MNQRCYNKDNGAYKDYGGRGVKVCKAWRKANPNGLQNFVNWNENLPENERWKKGLQIDKDIKVPGSTIYSPKACSFVTPKENNNARRDKAGTVYVTPTWGRYKGKKVKFSLMWKEYGVVKYLTALMRYTKYKWSLKDSLLIKVKT
jgi:hypothetical protein